MRTAARVDATQDAIVSALRAAGATVQSLAQIGRGCPDILAALPNGSMFLFECKSKGGKLEESQTKWHIAWNAPVYVVRHPDEALKVIGVI